MATGINSENYQELQSTLGDRMVQQSAQCTSFWAPDYTKIKEIEVRKALAYAYPYESVWQASGEVPGVNRVPANPIMPPGMAGQSRSEERRVGKERVGARGSRGSPAHEKKKTKKMR